MVNIVFSSMTMAIASGDDSLLQESAGERHSHKQSILAAVAKEGTVCVEVAAGDVAPVAGSYMAKMSQQAVEVAVGSVAEQAGSFCVPKQDVLLIQQTFGLNTARDFAAHGEKKEKQTTTTTTMDFENFNFAENLEKEVMVQQFPDEKAGLLQTTFMRRDLSKGACLFAVSLVKNEVNCSSHKLGWSREHVPRLLQAFNKWRVSHNCSMADLHAERLDVHVDIDEKDLGPPMGRALVTRGWVPSGTRLVTTYSAGNNHPHDANSFRFSQLQFMSFLNTLSSTTQKCDVLSWSYGASLEDARLDIHDLSLVNHASGESASLRSDDGHWSYWANRDLAPGTQLTEDYCDLGEQPSWLDSLQDEADVSGGNSSRCW